MKRIIGFLLVVAGLFVLFQTAYAGTGTSATHYTTIDGKSRKYIVYQPTVCETKKCPLVFMFHGLGGTADQAASAAYNWQATADQNGFVVAFPESLTIPVKSFFGFQYDPAGKHWDIAPIMSPFTQTQDTHFVETMILEAALNYDILTSHVYATGHSYGGFFAYNVGMVLRDKIAAFAAGNAGMATYYGVSWPGYPLAVGSDPVPGYIVYSKNDTSIAPDYPQYSVNLYNAMVAKGHPVVLDEIIPGKGHAWDPARNQLIWNFFLANSAPLPEPLPEPEPEPEPLPEPEPSVVQFEQPFYQIPENTGSGTVIPLNLDKSSDEKIVVNVSLLDTGTAEEGVDFEVSGTPVVFAPGEVLKWMEVSAFSDALIEGDESAALSLQVVSGNAVLGDLSVCSFTVMDGTDVVSFDIPAADGVESAGGTEVSMNAVGKIYELITVAISVDPASTATQGVDFTLDKEIFVFEEGLNAGSFTLTVIPDEFLEQDETVVLNLSVVSGPAAVGANAQYVYTIKDDTEPPHVHLWKPKFFLILKDYAAIIFKHLAEPNWALLYDNGTEARYPYGPYAGYTPLDVEVSQVSPDYFWWTMFVDGSGKAGLWRRSSTQNNALDKYVFFGSGGLLDFALDRNGNPYVMWEKSDGSLLISKYRYDGKFVKNYTIAKPNGSSWHAKYLLVDNWNAIRVLWERNGVYTVENFNQGKKTFFFSKQYAGPAGYVISDFEAGLTSIDGASRLLFTDENGNAKVVRINRGTKGNLLTSFDISAPAGFRVWNIETGLSNYLHIALEGGDGQVEVRKVSAVTGVLQSSKVYSMD